MKKLVCISNDVLTLNVNEGTFRTASTAKCHRKGLTTCAINVHQLYQEIHEEGHDGSGR